MGLALSGGHVEPYHLPAAPGLHIVRGLLGRPRHGQQASGGATCDSFTSDGASV